MSMPTPPSSPRIRAAGASLVVAIDGPAASGKSSTAQWVAQRLGFRHIDSGALYRAATAVALARAGDTFDETTVLSFVGELSLEPSRHTFAPMWNGESMEELIRAPEVTRLVSRVAQMRGVRAWVDANVRRAAEGRDVVVDGRDIGTVVFPDAHLKVFLIADPWERARRRLTQRHGRAPTDAEIAEETEGRGAHRHHLSDAGGAGGAHRFAGPGLSRRRARRVGATQLRIHQRSVALTDDAD